MSRKIPAPALLLGLAGLLPFLWGAALSAGIGNTLEPLMPPVMRGDGRLIMLRYGGIILPFMSGVLWGFATKAEGAQAAMGYLLSVIPALWWFFLPGEGAQSALINLGIGFTGLLFLDYAFQKWQLAPPWWMALRLQLSSVVLAAIAVGIWI